MVHNFLKGIVNVIGKVNVLAWLEFKLDYSQSNTLATTVSSPDVISAMDDSSERRRVWTHEIDTQIRGKAIKGKAIRKNK